MVASFSAIMLIKRRQNTKKKNKKKTQKKLLWKARHSCWIHSPPAFGRFSLLQLKSMAVKLVAPCSLMFWLVLAANCTRRLGRMLISNVRYSGEPV